MGYNAMPNTMGPDFSILAQILNMMGLSPSTGNSTTVAGGANQGGTPNPLDILFNPISAVSGDVGSAGYAGNTGDPSQGLLQSILQQLLTGPTQAQPAASTGGSPDTLTMLKAMGWLPTITNDYSAQIAARNAGSQPLSGKSGGAYTQPYNGATDPSQMYMYVNPNDPSQGFNTQTGQMGSTSGFVIPGYGMAPSAAGSSLEPGTGSH